ncbi:ECF RNA polymerase sigma factor SigW [Fundidesulfovibrio magnetotacticus]|uniref:ECF RNA polymerase sigma factor SigW n=1 Tax=Fundidesulfovibrio magnetotacticus TaxID=2730080 RepID=A0A6V8LM77_9BACT|nr:RNA polymerase sigma factor [Fundidesulfovibrio magnetotacticus]GFK93783.1 ECF RNA polymerase sigma factor SigW [Fundidesulfovibrio magnetotacticus]
MKNVPDSDSGGAVDDARAVRMVLEGRTEAFAILVRRHQDYLFGLLRRHMPAAEVPEAAQDAFVKAFEKLGQLKQPESFRAWLSSLAIRRAIRYWRETGSRGEVSLSLAGEDGQSWLDAFLADGSRERHEEMVRRQEASSVVTWLLGRVKPDDRIALGLFYAGDHELTEIASMLGWSVEKVKVRLHRARKTMAEALRGAGMAGGTA